MFTQDEPHALVSLPLNGQEAASVIQASFLKCRHVVSGRIIRQKLTIARCIITSWSYKHQDKNLIIYVNPAQGLVEDIDGPIRKHIEVVALLAAEMYNAGRYEQSFTANQKVICMSEVTENSESLRMSIFKKLGIHYLAWALIGWGASCAFIRVVFVGTTLTAGLPFTFLGLLPLVCGVWIFSRDIGLSFRNPRSRIPVGLLIGILACISGVAERHSILLSVLLGWAVVALIRSRERERRAKIESHLEALGGVLALEKYLEDFSQKKGVARLSMVILSAACLLTFFLGKIQFP